MKTPAIAIFVKTCGFTPLKTRLAASLGQVKAEEFYRLSCKAISSVINSANEKLENAKLQPMKPYWAVAEDNPEAIKHWSEPVITQGSGGLGQRLYSVYTRLLAEHSSVTFIGADSPQLSPEVFVLALQEISRASFVIGPADDGGYYLFTGKTPIAERTWLSVPYSTDETAEVFAQNLCPLGRVSWLENSFDVDTSDDLNRLKKTMSTQTDLTEEQKILLNWL